MFSYLSHENGGLRGRHIAPVGRTLVIGLGGMGQRAMGLLEKSLPAECQDVRLLAVDSDGADLHDMHFENQVNLYDHGFAHMLRQGGRLDIVPGMEWVDPAGLPAFVPEISACGLRQVGRAMVLHRAGILRNAILHQLMQFPPATPVRVFVVAGATGGTGSGGFVDICYLLRYIALHYGISLNICGLLLLPDGDMGHRQAEEEQLALANAWALHKDLTALSRLAADDKTYVCNYVFDTFSTQEAPTDFCVYISDRNAFNIPHRENALRTAAEYILGCLTVNEIRAFGSGCGRVFCSSEVLPFRQAESVLAAEVLEKIGAEKVMDKDRVLALGRQLCMDPRQLMDKMQSCWALEEPEMPPTGALPDLISRDPLRMIAPWEQAYERTFGMSAERMTRELEKLHHNQRDLLESGVRSLMDEGGPRYALQGLQGLEQLVNKEFYGAFLEKIEQMRILQEQMLKELQHIQNDLTHFLRRSRAYRQYWEIAKDCVRARLELWTLEEILKIYRRFLSDILPNAIRTLEKKDRAWDALLERCRMNFLPVGRWEKGKWVEPIAAVLRFNITEMAAREHVSSWNDALDTVLDEWVNPVECRNAFAGLLGDRCDLAVEAFYPMLSLPATDEIVTYRADAVMHAGMEALPPVPQLRILMKPYTFGAATVSGFHCRTVPGYDCITALHILQGAGLETVPYREQMERCHAETPGTDLHIV